MKKILIFALSAVCILSGQAAVTFIKAVPKDQDVPLWMRYPKISPDGSKIAFSYQGDIYYVPVSGGEAVRLRQPHHSLRLGPFRRHGHIHHEH